MTGTALKTRRIQLPFAAVDKKPYIVSEDQRHGNAIGIICAAPPFSRKKGFFCSYSDSPLSRFLPQPQACSFWGCLISLAGWEGCRADGAKPSHETI